MDVQGKTAIITGSSSGVGSEVAVKLAQSGANVVINYVNTLAGAEQTQSRIEELGGHALIFKADVSVDAECRALVQSAVQEYGQLDILVNNAGATTYIEHSELELLSDEIWQATLGTNLMGPFYMSRAAAPVIAKQGGGEIVMTSSVASQTTAGSSIAYCASKAALNNMTRCLAKALGSDNIRVNAILPGLIDGRWASEGWGDAWEDVKAFVRSTTALNTIATPEDVADSIISIITGSDIMTGQLINLDGGYTIQ